MLISASFQLHNKLRKETEAEGETYKITKLRRNEEMDEYDLIHWHRSFEERETVLRDISWYFISKLSPYLLCSVNFVKSDSLFRLFDLGHVTYVLL